jgi:putative DNA methylase
MPDHLHALLVPREPYTLSQVMQCIKGYSSRRINADRSVKGPLWQASYYDRIIRNEAQLQTVVAYIEENPVKAKLVSRAEDHPWSSAYKGRSTDIEAWLGA